MKTAGPGPVGALWTLARTDFKVRYHGTVMGFLWAMLKPVGMCVVLLSVFSFLFGSNPNYALDLVIGLFLYEFFAEATKSGLVALHTKGYLVGKSRLPRWLLVATSASNAVITIAVAGAAILLFIAARGPAPSILAVGLSVGYALQFLGIILGFSLASSVLFVRYRDLNQIWEVVIQAGFFVAPIIYPLDVLPERFHIYLYLWPPTPVIQFTRQVLVAGQIPTLKAHLLLAGLTALVLAGGIVIYRRLSPRAAEYL